MKTKTNPRNLLQIFFCLVLIASCRQKEEIKNPLQYVLKSKHPKIRRVMDSLSNYEVQVRYTQINRIGGQVKFEDFDFQVSDSNYFYPASTVKFPIAVIALEKLNQIDTLNLDTRFYIEGDTVETTFRKAVSEIFAVSDNNANNRLVEFLGQNHINAVFVDKNLGPGRIAHRLGQHSKDLATKPLIVYLNDSTTSILKGTFNREAQTLHLENIKRGTGYIEEGTLIEEPFDFSLKNYYPITTQHEVLKRVVFPREFIESERFQLSNEQYEQLYEAMYTVPRKVGYDPDIYYDSYCKFFMYGDQKENIPDHIKIYNKVGFAYGTLTDCAYITDEKHNIEFLLTATILVNKNGIFNDNKYEYDEIGIPFLAELGRQLYHYELERKSK